MSKDDEFALIRRYFQSLTQPRSDVVLGIGDDGAILRVPENHQLVVTTDALVAGTHFLADADPQAVGHKALAANLSDLAAMGATPAWCSLSLVMPHVDHAWLKGFCSGFSALAAQHQVSLIGGDTTKGPLSLTLTLHGFVPNDQALRRSGAKAGDLIYLSGCLGESLAGLDFILAPIEKKHELAAYFKHQHFYATPRVELGIALRGLASAALDISDGLMGDLPHLLTASGLGADIFVDQLQITPELLAYVGDEKKAAHYALSSGEEYELCFTISPNHRERVECLMTDLSIPFQCIGQTRLNSGIQLFWQDQPLDWQLGGWDHFQDNQQ